MRKLRDYTALALFRISKFNMKKENVKVAVTDKEQAEMYRKVLVGFGCKIAKYCFTYEEYEQFLIFDSKDEDWFLDNAAHPSLNSKHLITFGQLVDLLTRKPLLISEDGVELFEGHSFYTVTNNKEFINIDKNWGFLNENNTHDLSKNSYVLTDKNSYKAFKTKQAALDYIDKMNKPKEIRIDFSGCMTADVSKNEVKLNWIGGRISIGNDEIKQIMDAFDRLK